MQTVFANESVTKRKYQSKGNQFVVHHFSGNFHSTSSGTQCWWYVYTCWFTQHDSINVEKQHPNHQWLQYMTHHAELKKPHEWALHDAVSQKQVLSMCRFPQQLCPVWKNTSCIYSSLKYVIFWKNKNADSSTSRHVTSDLHKLRQIIHQIYILPSSIR